MKKIGILTYHSVYNFGANLQVLSTLCYFRNKGYDAKIINWRPRDLSAHYEKTTPAIQAEAHEVFFRQHYELTDICHTDEEIASIVDKEGLDAIVIGSDAVCRHFPILIRYRPTRSRKLFLRSLLSTPDIFPNPFWGSFYTRLKNKVPMVLMSVSSQGTLYRYTLSNERKKISKALSDFSYISVRDSWTRQVFDYFSYGKSDPKITPDPVFGFNANVPPELTSPAVVRRFSLPKRYVILSFKQRFSPSSEWVRRFVACCREKGTAVVSLPYPQEENRIEVDMNIPLPLDPIEWYNIIKHSTGYIGNNMHPVVVSMHNAVPFFSFDYYADYSRFSRKVNLEFSKIYDLLNHTELLDNYVNVQTRGFRFPEPELVFERVHSFDKEKAKRIANTQLEAYRELMATIERVISE